LQAIIPIIVSSVVVLLLLFVVAVAAIVPMLWCCHFATLLLSLTPAAEQHADVDQLLQPCPHISSLSVDSLSQVVKENILKPRLWSCGV